MKNFEFFYIDWTKILIFKQKALNFQSKTVIYGTKIVSAELESALMFSVYICQWQKN